MEYGTLIAFTPMIFAAGLYLGSLTGRRPRKRLREIKALMRNQNTELSQYDAGSQHSLTASMWVDVYVLVAPNEEE